MGKCANLVFINCSCWLVMCSLEFMSKFLYMYVFNQFDKLNIVAIMVAHNTITSQKI